MVMSVSAAAPRNSCIRCGGVEFRELVWRKPVVNTMDRSPLLMSTTIEICFSTALFAAAGTAAKSAVAECFQ
jgi:hypothetical protein